MNNTIRGRQGLQAWDASKPTNFFNADVNLQRVLQRSMGVDYATAEANFKDFGAACATIIDENAKIEDLASNHPRLERWTGIGERIETVEFHPRKHVSGRLIWRAGMMALQAEPGNIVRQMGLFYLLGHNGEGSHMCSIACTAGLIRALQQAANDDLQAKFLPPLLSTDYDTAHVGAQFLTEVQGGSDVGANAVVATSQADGTWRITGEKWFCSNFNADQFLMTARASDANGTRGLGLFLVPRHLGDGSTNGFYVRRLKDKLGTRSLASAEIDFENALAYPVGAIENGFKYAVELVLNTSRLMNAITCAGVMRRAYLEASHYACHREAFGNPIMQYPMVQEAIADIKAEAYAATASGFALARLLDALDTGTAQADDQAVYRMLVNINKYITSVMGSAVVHRAIEVLGGNGAIESFSILPRLYRDMVVLESWEGTHNVLCVQVWRDIQRYQLHAPLLRFLQDQLARITHPQLQSDVEAAQTALDGVQTMIDQLANHPDTQYQQAHLRRLVDRMAFTAQAVLLLSEADWELSQQLSTDKPDVARYFIHQHLVAGYDPLQDEDYLKLLERITLTP